MRGVLLSSVAEASIQVAGQSARLYPLHLLCLPGHAHLLRAAGQSTDIISLFSCLPLLYSYKNEQKVSSSYICACRVSLNDKLL